MTTTELKDLGFEPVTDIHETDITGGFCGDLLSWVMGRAKQGLVWFTIMGNINALAVASLADVAAIVLCQGVKMDQAVLDKAAEQGINIFCTDQPVYEAASILIKAMD